MKRFALLLVSVLLSTFVFAQTAEDIAFIEQVLSGRDEVVIQFPHNGDRDLVRELGRIVSIDKVNDTYVRAYANTREYEQFKTYGIEYAPVYEYYNRTRALNMATTVDQMANWDRYPTYSVYLQMMQNYATNYPDLCRLVTMGQAVSGRDIVTLVISDNVNVDEDEPEFWWSSTMHGDETTGWYFMLRLIDHLLTNYGTDEQVTNLVNNIEIHITPNTNPDGTFYRSNDGTSMSNGRRYNQNGVDLNRNFPFINGTASQGNQPEITMMTAYADAHNFVMAANGHGGDECLNYPWDEDGWTHARRPNADDDWWEYVCWQYANTVHAINSRILTGPSDVSGSNGVTKGSEWYSIDGGRQDYMNYYHHCKEITMEWSSTKMLGTENLNTYWNYHRQAILDYTQQVLYGFNGIVTDACSGNPLGGVHVFINNHDTDNTDVYTSNGVGDYHRPIYGGTYSVTFSKDGYISQTINVTTQTGTATRLDVALYPENMITPNFVADNVQVFEGDVVNFTNTTSGSYLSQTWSFTGGTPSTSTATNPVVTYSTQGTYDVALSLTSADGCLVTTTKENYITVYAHAAPQVDFEANITTVNEGSAVTFTDLSTNVPTSWNWTFEGGTPSTSTAQNPQITYNTVGTYEVTLTASNAYGAGIETKTAYITVVSEINMSNADIYACGGTYKDPAGDGNYSNNTNITQTIYPASEGSYVVLTFTELGIQNPTTSQWGGQTTYNDYIKIYDGTSTSATLIGRYAGSDPTAIGTNGVVTATNNDGALTIQFYSNNSTTGSGWVAEISCYSPEPEAEFTVRITDACTGSVATTNTSNDATSYLWNFGDGSTSTDEAPTHTYATSGTYTITLTASNPNGTSTLTHTVEIDMPEITSTNGANACGASTLSLTAAGNGTMHWYDAATGGNAIAEGNTYTALFDETTTVYVESIIGNVQNYSIGLADNSTSTAYTQNNNTARGLNFTVSAPLTLVSVDVYCSQATTKTITIQNTSTNANVYSQSHTLASGKNTLTLNLELAAGTYRIYANNCRYLFRVTTTNFSSFVIDDVMSITGAYNGNGYYYAFYNMQIQAGSECSSERVAVTATIVNGGSGSLNLGDDISQCEGAATLDAGAGFDSYLWSTGATTQSISAATTGTYSVTVTSGTCIMSDDVTVTINQNPTIDLGDDITQCGGTATLNAGAGYTYSWNTGATTQTISVSSTGEYVVTITSNGCTASDAVNVTINQNPSVDLGDDVSQCGGTATLDAGAGFSSYVWNTGATTRTITATTGNYSVVVTDGNGCTASDNVNVTINAIPEVSISVNNVTLTAEVDGASSYAYLWSTNATSSSIEALASQQYCVTVTDANSCEASNCIQFTLPTIDIEISDAENGTITGDESVTYGDDYTFTVSTAECYQIESVTVNGIPVILNNGSYTIVNVTEEQVISATFAQISYTITANAGVNGTINPDGATTVYCGESQSYSIIPDAGYMVEDVLVDGISQGTITSYTFNNVTANHTISVTFVEIPANEYTITIESDSEGGEVSPTGTQLVEEGEDFTFTVTAYSCYEIAEVMVNGSPVTITDGSYTIYNITEPQTVNVTFAILSYVISASAEDGGSISPAGDSDVDCGNGITYSITPEEGYEILDVLVDGASVGAVETYSFTNVTENHTILAQFREPLHCDVVENLEVSVYEYGNYISWDANEDAQGYKLYRDGEFLADLYTTEYLDLGYGEGVGYYVVTVCDFGESEPSEIVVAVVTSIENTEISINLYPNPAVSDLNIEGGNIEEIEYYNSIGQLMGQVNVSSDKVSMDISNLVSGVYSFVVKTTDGNVIVKKVVVRR